MAGGGRTCPEGMSAATFRLSAGARAAWSGGKAGLMAMSGEGGRGGKEGGEGAREGEKRYRGVPSSEETPGVEEREAATAAAAVVVVAVAVAWWELGGSTAALGDMN